MQPFEILAAPFNLVAAAPFNLSSYEADAFRAPEPKARPANVQLPPPRTNPNDVKTSNGTWPWFAAGSFIVVAALVCKKRELERGTDLDPELEFHNQAREAAKQKKAPKTSLKNHVNRFCVQNPACEREPGNLSFFRARVPNPATPEPEINQDPALAAQAYEAQPAPAPAPAAQAYEAQPAPAPAPAARALEEETSTPATPSSFAESLEAENPEDLLSLHEDTKSFRDLSSSDKKQYTGELDSLLAERMKKQTSPESPTSTPGSPPENLSSEILTPPVKKERFSRIKGWLRFSVKGKPPATKPPELPKKARGVAE